jgi:hypothetical protein
MSENTQKPAPKSKKTKSIRLRMRKVREKRGSPSLAPSNEDRSENTTKRRRFMDNKGRIVQKKLLEHLTNEYFELENRAGESALLDASLQLVIGNPTSLSPKKRDRAVKALSSAQQNNISDQKDKNKAGVTLMVAGEISKASLRRVTKIVGIKDNHLSVQEPDEKPNGRIPSHTTNMRTMKEECETVGFVPLRGLGITNSKKNGILGEILSQFYFHFPAKNLIRLRPPK